MFYYIYCVYITGHTCYKIYQYWGVAKTTYTVCIYTYNIASSIYYLVKPLKQIKNTRIDDWEII